eukprot:2057274-Ditylum_brightwellii.AAC.1
MATSICLLQGYRTEYSVNSKSNDQVSSTSATECDEDVEEIEIVDNEDMEEIRDVMASEC